MKDSDRILHILRGTGATSVSTVAKTLRIDRERVFRLMNELRAAGKVAHVGPSRWNLTATGESIADDDLLRQMKLFATAAN